MIHKNSSIPTQNNIITAPLHRPCKYSPHPLPNYPNKNHFHIITHTALHQKCPIEKYPILHKKLHTPTHHHTPTSKRTYKTHLKKTNQIPPQNHPKHHQLIRHFNRTPLFSIKNTAHHFIYSTKN